MKPLVAYPTLIGLLTSLSISLPASAQQGVQRDAEFAQGGQGRNAERTLQLLQGRGGQKTTGGNSGRQSLGDGSQDAQTAAQNADQGPGQGRERLSPEERRQLRLDINAAGRDIYRRNGK